jgi:DNA-directed RNA polymerase specialized sigma24 family protein
LSQRSIFPLLSSADFHTGLIHSERTSRTKEKWTLTPEAFEKLLNLFSQDRDEAGAQYELIRRKLVRFFEWRAIKAAEEYADETINRVARRIAEGQKVDNIKSYFYGVARLIFMEALKEPERAVVALSDGGHEVSQTFSEDIEPDRRVLCFDRCLDSLPAENRKLILEYYREERRAKIETRQELAATLQIPLNALRIRAHRIRVSLERCITECLKAVEVK